MLKWLKKKKTNRHRKVAYVSANFDDLTGEGLKQAIADNKRSFRMRNTLDEGYFHQFVNCYALIENEKGRIETAHYSCVKFID